MHLFCKKKKKKKKRRRRIVIKNKWIKDRIQLEMWAWTCLVNVCAFMCVNTLRIYDWLCGCSVCVCGCVCARARVCLSVCLSVCRDRRTVALCLTTPGIVRKDYQSSHLLKPLALEMVGGRFTPIVWTDRLVGLVIKASASRAEAPGFESRLRRDFSGVESYQGLQNCHSSGYPARRLAL